MMPGEVIGGELRRHATPAESQPRAQHRDLGARVTEHAQQVGDQARERQCGQHHSDRQLLGGVGGAARRSKQPGADHAGHDRADRHVLVSPRMLAKHALGEQHQYEQARRQRGLYDDERSEQQREHLQWPAEDREAGAEQPARALHEAPGQRETEVLLVWSLLGVHRLQGDP